MTVSVPEAEWDITQRALMVALAEWESDRCPCGCGQQMSDCLVDSTRPPEDRTAYSAAYAECAAGMALEAAIEHQNRSDQALAEQTGRPVLHRHRLWQVSTTKRGGA